MTAIELSKEPKYIPVHLAQTKNLLPSATKLFISF